MMTDSLEIQFIFESHRNNGYNFVGGSAYATFKNHFYSYLSNYHSSSNFMQNKFKFGFQNEWVCLQIGRNNEHWGAGDNLQLVLSNDAGYYDYFMLSSDYGNIRVKYIHGFLESIDNGVNRYLNAKGIEWTDKKSLVISLSEIIIYSGLGRHLELGYLNPMSSHIEIELNDRLTQQEGGQANAVWQFSLDYIFKDKLRFSSNIVYDEIVFDPHIETGSKNRKGYSIGLVIPIIDLKNYNIDLHSSIISIDTPTFRHGASGYTNFSNQYKPLGWTYGSDSKEFKAGLSFFNKNNLIIKSEVGKRKIGPESLLKKPYAPYFEHLVNNNIENNVSYELFILNRVNLIIHRLISLNGNMHYGSKDLSIWFNLEVKFPDNFKI